MFGMLVGMHIKNEESYTKYRNNMMPLLLEYGGAFTSDFKVAQVLSKVHSSKINRVFTITFPTKEKCDDFFSSDSYIEIKKEHFEGAASDITIIHNFNCDDSK